MTKIGQFRKSQKCLVFNILGIFQKRRKLHVLKNTKIMVFRCLHRHDHDGKYNTTVVSNAQGSPLTAPWDVWGYPWTPWVWVAVLIHLTPSEEDPTLGHGSDGM